ncbi:Rhodanese-like domain-containing protein [Bisporella sp. PMI_857]|nr:Rhodanese-like domain-containing protein [Bisporella sp. PMI_857]
MATPGIAFSILSRASRSLAHGSARQITRVVAGQPARPVFPATNRNGRTSPINFRTYSVAPIPNPSKIYTFADVQSFISFPSPDRVLIDTREPHELKSTGTIPSSINIPVTTQPDAFFITEEEFEDRFGVERPTKETEVVFYCRAGVRSKAAAELARQAGWQKVSEYSGSWLDWEKNGGQVEGV